MKICWIIGNKEEESILTDSEPLKLPMSDKRQWVKIFIEFVIQLDWLGGWTKPEDLYCENSCYNNDTKGIQRKQVIYSCSFFTNFLVTINLFLRSLDSVSVLDVSSILNGNHAIIELILWPHTTLNPWNKIKYSKFYCSKKAIHDAEYQV